MRIAATAVLCVSLLTGGQALAQRDAQPSGGLPEPLVRLTPQAETAAGFLRCLDARNATIVSAHRGGPMARFPENAIETFAHTLSRMPALIEMDVRRTRDGALVLIHDEDVARTTSGAGRVGELSLDELRGFELEDHTGHRPREGYRIPALEEALAWGKDRAIVFLDVKRGVDPTAVAAAARKAGAPGRTVMIVGPDDAARVAALEPGISFSISVRSATDLDAALAAGVPEDRIIAFTGNNRPDPALWALLDGRGIPVIHGTLWDGDREIATTNDDARYARLAEQGVDVLVTDRHFEAHWALQSRQDTAAAVRACVRG